MLYVGRKGERNCQNWFWKDGKMEYSSVNGETQFAFVHSAQCIIVLASVPYLVKNQNKMNNF